MQIKKIVRLGGRRLSGVVPLYPACSRRQCRPQPFRPAAAGRQLHRNLPELSVGKTKGAARMRLISPGANPPADVDRYLLPHEQEVITVRKHPAVLLAPVAWAVIGVVTRGRAQRHPAPARTPR